MNDIDQGHTLNRHDEELDDLRQRMLTMGRRVVDQVEHALVAFNTRDRVVAERVVAADKAVDRLDIEAEDAIIKLIAQRSSVAMDLRTLLALSKCCSDLARIADEAVVIATAVIELFGREQRVPKNPLVCDIKKMGEMALQSLQSVLLLFEVWNEASARAVIARRRDMGDELKAHTRCVMTYVMEDYRIVGFAITVGVVMRSLERIGHYAENIARDAIFRANTLDAPLDAP